MLQLFHQVNGRGGNKMDHKCPVCGAPMSGNKCPYCDYEKEPEKIGGPYANK